MGAGESFEKMALSEIKPWRLFAVSRKDKLKIAGGLYTFILTTWRSGVDQEQEERVLCSAKLELDHRRCPYVGATEVPGKEAKLLATCRGLLFPHDLFDRDGLRIKFMVPMVGLNGGAFPIEVGRLR